MAKTPRRRNAQFTEPVTVPMQSVAQFIQMLQNKERFNHFMDAAKMQNAEVKIEPQSAEFIQKFLNDHSLHEHMASAVVDPCPNKPFCN